MIYSKHIFIAFLIIFSSAASGQEQEVESRMEKVISNWHDAAAKADFETYSSLMTDDAIFIGTDPTEYWKGKEFRDFAKPYFDRGKAWTFYTIKRNIFVDNNYKFAWFDELLETQMGLCRGSGVLVKTENQWKINHYVLSITIPNENVDEVKGLKAAFETKFIQSLKN